MTEQPGYPADQILRGLSLPRRIGYTVAGLGGLAGAAMIGMLWATEPVPLPARTQLAFAGLITIGLAWATFAGWALARRPLFAADRVIAATLGVVFSALTTIGTLLVAAARSSTPEGLAALGIGLTMTAIATVMLVRARNYRAGLLTRQHEMKHAAVSPLPIGPLALAMRHHRHGSAHRRLAIAAVILGLALVAGIALLLR